MQLVELREKPEAKKEEKVELKLIRNETADLLKGITAFLIIHVHLTEFLARPELFESLYGKYSLFFGGVPCAPLLMCIMGYFLAASVHSSSEQLKRGLAIFFGGILLNFVLNGNLLLKIYTRKSHLNPYDFIFGVDILLFAGLAVILITILKPILRFHYLVPFFLAFFVASATVNVNSVLSFEPSFIKYLFAFLGGNYHFAYFPIFPWLAYPLAGFFFYEFDFSFVKSLGNKVQLFLLFILTAYVCLTFDFGFNNSSNLSFYYHHNIKYFCWAAGFLFFLVHLFFLINQTLDWWIPIRFSKWLGKNLLTFYIFQWIIIGNLTTSFYKSLNFWQLISWEFQILVLVSFLVLIWEKSEISVKLFGKQVFTKN
ncbi:heparan-alpha-glucosaminide N-acetyltransferase domain-containing protein [Candidatus Riflebacteria bacterium]